MPSTSTFYQWLDNNTEKAKQYARATEVRADIIFDDILSIADENSNDTYINDNGIEVVNSDVIQRSRLRIDARKWVLSKLNPKKFGDKIQTEHSGEVTTNVISLGSGIKPNETTS
jgi:Pyruvate/2-oxoacid:ferredoxin oxidoreductase gamma subunit